MSELHTIRPSNWESLSTKNREAAEQVTQGSYWDYEQFKRSMFVLAALKIPVPSYNRPESINIDGMHGFISELDQRTRKNGREHARVMLADWGTGKLLAHKNTHVGSANKVKIVHSKQPGREYFQSVVGVLHTHPIPEHPRHYREGLSLSTADFEALLTSDEMVFMHVRYDQENLIALKTTATPTVSEERVKTVLQDLKEEFLDSQSSDTFTQRAVKFTKAVCLETGLTLYRTSPGSTIAKRDDVTN